MEEIKQIQEHSIGDKVYFLDPRFNTKNIDNANIHIDEYVIESISETKEGFRYGFAEKSGRFIGSYLFKTKKDINNKIKIKIQERIDELTDIINNLK